MSTMRWMAFAYRQDRSERAAEIGTEEALHEADRDLEAVGFNSSSSQHATKEEAEDAAREMLRKLRELDSGASWAACVASPGPDHQGTGACYSVD